MTRGLRFKPGFDQKRLTWGKPDSPPRPLCSCCHGALPEVPLMMWRNDGSAISFCDDCARAALEPKP
jgi:hypothetical protein